MNIRQQYYRSTKAGVHDRIEQLLIKKQEWIDDQLSNFSVFERTTDIIKLINQQAADMYNGQLESLHKLYNEL